MSSSVIRGGDSNRYPAIVTSAGRLKVDLKADDKGVSPSGNFYAESYLKPERFQEDFNSQDATTPVAVKSKTASRKIYLTSVMCSVSGAMFVRFEDDAGTILIPNTYLAANGGFIAEYSDETPLVVDTNKDLVLVAGASGGVSINAVGYLKE